MLRIGKHAACRRFFEDDEEFPDSWKPLLDCYERVSRRAAWEAKCAAENGKKSSFRRAQITENKVRAMEEVMVFALRQDEFLGAEFFDS